MVLSKYNSVDSASGQTAAVLSLDGEIMDEEEDSTVSDCHARVLRVLGPGVRVMNFNAFGRIVHHTGSSQSLISMVRKLGFGGARRINTEVCM